MRPSIFPSLPSSPAHPAIYCPIRINVWSPLASLEKGRVYELATHQNYIHLTLLAVNLSQEMDNERRYSNLLSPTLHSIGSNGQKHPMDLLFARGLIHKPPCTWCELGPTNIPLDPFMPNRAPFSIIKDPDFSNHI